MKGGVLIALQCFLDHAYGRTGLFLCPFDLLTHTLRLEKPGNSCMQIGTNIGEGGRGARCIGFSIDLTVGVSVGHRARGGS